MIKEACNTSETLRVGVFTQESDPSGKARPAVHLDDVHLIEALRRGSETAFVALLNRYQLPLISLAMRYVSNHTVAEEVVQETWLGVFQGLHQFEGRSSLQTWIFRILINRAQTRGLREKRSISFSSLPGSDTDSDDFDTDTERFFSSVGDDCSNQWTSFIRVRNYTPEETLLWQELWACIEHAIQKLPSQLRKIIILRDICGKTSEEVCMEFNVTKTYQRVLLHRARAQVRCTLLQYYGEE